jgi:hypothetical protein
MCGERGYHLDILQHERHGSGCTYQGIAKGTALDFTGEDSDEKHYAIIIVMKRRSPRSGSVEISRIFYMYDNDN